MPTPRPLPEAFRDRPFSRAEFESAGGSSGQLRTRAVLRPYHGVQSLELPGDVLERCRHYAVRLRPGQAFSHATALLLFGTPLPKPLEDRPAVDVAAAMPAQPPRTRGVIGHRLRSAPETMVLEGLPVVVPPEAWCQLAPSIELDDLIAAADHVLNLLPDPIQAREETARAIARSHRAGRARLESALAEARPGTRSPGETRVRLLLLRAGIREPLLNETQHGADGRWLGAPDLCWPDAKVSVEYEGDHHFSERKQYRKDVLRYARFEDDGWSVIRAHSDQLAGPLAQQLIARVRRALNRATAA